MKLIIETKTQKEIEIPVPSFWKDCYVSEKYRAVLDEKTFVDLYRGDHRSCIASGDPELHSDNIITAHNDWQLATEAEFFEAFERVYKSLSLSPVVVTSTPLVGCERTLKTVSHQPEASHPDNNIDY